MTALWRHVGNRRPVIAGQTYRVRLEMSGTTTTTLTLYVNGVQVLTVNDTTAPLTIAGKAGIVDGATGFDSVTKAATTGIHFDNFQVKPSTYPRAVDSKGSNTGDYINDPVLGVTGAFSDDSAARFTGVNDYMQAPTTGIPTGNGIAVGGDVVKDHQHEQGGAVQLRRARRQPGVRPVDECRWRHDDCMGQR